jgi:COP9 signalosome complex subunit 12
MAKIFADFQQAQRIANGLLLANCLAPVNTAQDPRRLESLSQLSNHQTVSADVRYHLFQQPGSIKLQKQESNGWVEIFVNLWKCARELADIEAGIGGDWIRAFDAYKELCNHLVRGYSSLGFSAWTIPCFHTAGKYLRLLAIKADNEAKAGTNGETFSGDLADDIVSTTQNEKLEQATWIINRMFQTCLTDRAELTESRKWGIYSTANLLFKTYFKLNSVSLTKNVIRALDAADDDLPPLHLFPKPQQCTFKFYRGVIDFLSENYSDAEEHLEEALALCWKHSIQNREQILTYLIPTHVLNHHRLPTDELLARAPTLSKILSPIFHAIRLGHLHAFDVALANAETDLIRRRIYLTVERFRDLCMRNLFRKIFLYAGFEEQKDANSSETTGQIRRTRIRVEEFEAAMKVSCRGGEDVVDRDEVECFLAGMIYKNLMKGYIARDRGIVVLSKAGAFPGTGL